MKLRPLLLLLLATTAHAVGPSILSNTDHVVGSITAAVTALSGTSPTDQSCPTGGTGVGGNPCGSAGSFQTAGSTFISFAAGAGPFYLAGTSTTGNHQPYTVLTQSSTGYNIGLDQSNYATLQSNAITYSMPYCPGSTISPNYPPIEMYTVLPHGSASITSSPPCGYDYGNEFSLSANYLVSGSTSSPSSTGATFAAVIAQMKSDHSTWTWNDIKGALRQTASNWSGGYQLSNSGALGYGDVSYSSATAISSTSSIYLEPPGMQITARSGNVTITLYPFRQTRRVKEVVYIGGTWPAASSVNEMTAAQIASAGGTLIYTSNGVDETPQFSYAATSSGTATFYALTLDGSGNGSRVETFMPQSVTFTVGSSCVQ